MQAKRRPTINGQPKRVLRAMKNEKNATTHCILYSSPIYKGSLQR